jgi:putative phage-type endonuclease
MLTKEQLVERLSYVTGSDAATICGLNPWKTAVQLWLEKTGRSEQDDISEANHIKFGNYMEDGVAKWFEAESGKTVVKEPAMLIHPKHDWMAGNIDFKVVGENAILECKTALKTDGWGDGENIIPEQYLLQAAHYCAVGNFDKCYIGVVFSMTREFRWYVYDRNEILEQKLIKAEYEFWHNCVLADTAPIAKTEADVLVLCKRTTDNPITATPQIATTVYSLRTVKDKIDQLKDEEQLYRDSIATFMIEHEVLIDIDGSLLVTWKQTKPIEGFDKAKFKKEHPELYKKYIKMEDPRRPMSVKV